MSGLDKLGNGRAWTSFCDSLEKIGHELLTESVPDDGLTQVEGYRYLTRLLRLSLEKHVEFSDPDRPEFFSLSHETAKIGNDNPDNVYLNCTVSGEESYLISGQRGTVHYLSIESKAGGYGDGGDMAPTGHLELADIEIDETGKFEIHVSMDKKCSNWLPMQSDTDSILIRQTFRDRRTEVPATFSIARIDSSDVVPLDPVKLITALENTTPYVEGTVDLFRHWMDLFLAHENSLPPNDQQMCLRAGGDPEIHYHNSRWILSNDQALLIEFYPPVCRTWNFQLSNYWMESLDYRFHRISINQDSAILCGDGLVQILVSAFDPGEAFPNWLTTAGHTCGAMLLRYVGATKFPEIKTRVEDISELVG